MKKFAIAGWVSCVLSFVFALAMTVNACNSRYVPEPEPLRDASADAQRALSQTHKLGAAPDAGPYVPVTFMLTTPIASPFGDAPITGVELRAVSIDLTSYNAPNGQAIGYFGSIGGDPSKVRQVVISLSPTNQANFTAAFKSAAASQFGVTFQ